MLIRKLMHIDIVYTWVNSNDLAWAEKRNAVLGLAEFNSEIHHHDALYEDNQELKYSLRSIAKYMPWVNNIFIVTDNQIPDWLNINHPKIHIIDHKNIFSNHKDLPTFNSCSIETHLHHIEGLAEHFVYFNDDMLLGNHCTPEHFYLKNGKPRIFVAEILPIPNSKMLDINKRNPNKINVHQHTIVNTRLLVKNKLGKSVYNNLRHGPKPLLKSKLFELEEIFRNEVNNTSKHTFRTKEDIIFIYLFDYWAIAKKIGSTKYQPSVSKKKKYFKSRFTFGFVNLHDEDVEKQLQNILQEKPFTFCLNQTPETSKENLIFLKNFLDEYYPEKSEFEVFPIIDIA